VLKIINMQDIQKFEKVVMLKKKLNRLLI